MSAHPTDRLLRYLDGSLDEAERRDVERHLAGCSECASDLTTIRDVDSRLSTLEPLDPEPGSAERLLARIALSRQERLPTWRLVAAALLLVAATAAGTTLIVRRTVPPPPAASAARSPAYMLIFHEDVGWRQSLPPDQRAARSKAFVEWVRDLDARQKLLSGAGRRLRDEAGRLVATGAQVTRLDDTFPRDSTIVTGFILVTAENYDEATALAMGCPIVTQGKGRVEVRRVA